MNHFLFYGRIESAKIEWIILLMFLYKIGYEPMPCIRYVLPLRIIFRKRLKKKNCGKGIFLFLSKGREVKGKGCGNHNAGADRGKQGA